MAGEPNLLIIGASARAAVFSALRAGFRPWCADLFADADLRAVCPAERLTGRYPAAFIALMQQAPHAPWIYTGGLENHPRVVQRLVELRSLWGNDAHVLTAVRQPTLVAPAVREAGLPCPQLWRPENSRMPHGRWLLKPLRGSGGTGLRFITGDEPVADPRRFYVQEFIPGEPRAAIYVGLGEQTRLLGVTRQLIGQDWLHAAPFQYCGSVGPLTLTSAEETALQHLGKVLAVRFGLRGLFGVDGIWREGSFWPVEVNPRYTASVEVLEYATGLRSLAWHASAFDSAARMLADSAPVKRAVVGKAILFARRAIPDPANRLRKLPDGAEVYGQRSAAWNMPAFADIPAPGELIQERQPVLSLFAEATDIQSCEDALRRAATDIEGGLLSNG